jgi:hypothetical protein
MILRHRKGQIGLCAVSLFKYPPHMLPPGPLFVYYQMHILAHFLPTLFT